MKTAQTLILLLLTAVLGLAVSGVQAQSIDSSISPAVYHLIAKPGNNHIVNVRLTNTGDPQVFVLKQYQLGDPDIHGNLSIVASSDLAVKLETPDEEKTFDKPILLRSQTAFELPVHITIPKDAPDGEYLFAVIAQSEKTIENQGTITARISGGNGSLIQVTVTQSNQETKQVEPALFQTVTSATLPFTNIHMVDVGTPVPLSFILKNSGKFAVTPTGSVTLKKRDKVLLKKEIIPGYVYPSTQRLIEVSGFNADSCLQSFSGELCSNDYSYIFDDLGFGMYEVTADVTYGINAPISYSRDYFLVLPYKMIGGVFLIITALLAYLIYLWVHYFKHKNNISGVPVIKRDTMTPKTS